MTAIQRCPRCGEGPAETEWDGESPWVCLPCRAEGTGTAVLRLPHQAHSNFALRLAHMTGERATPKEAIQSWAAGLESAAKGLRRAARILVAAVPRAEEAVAEALMAGPVPAAGSTGDSLELRLEDLPPSLARKLAEEVALAHAPDLTEDELRELAAERRRA